MSDFWQATTGGLVINLDHVIIVDRPSADLRITTVTSGVTLTIKAGSLDEAEFLLAMTARINRSGSR